MYSATETVDHRYAGSTTVDMRNAAKRALWGTFDDFQAFTSDVRIDPSGRAGECTRAKPLGCGLSPTTNDRGEIQRNQSLLQNALGEFLPAQVRALFRIETT